MTAMLRPAEAAEVLRVHPKTLGRWAREGLIAEVRTPGGHRRYAEDEILALASGQVVLKARLMEALERRHWTVAEVDTLIKEVQDRG